MGLSLYKKKRKFSKTPEPEGAVELQAKKSGLKFVVQKHHASRLHYDFRLEMEGVMKSWAVPKGPSLNPKDKRLAMMVEDHPMSYRTFEGSIPEGNYGAGEVIVWDAGTYRSTNTPTSASAKEQEKFLLAEMKKGDIKITMDGEKLHGDFALVKTRGFGGKDNSWLLIKHKDDYASEEDITKQVKSVLSDRMLPEDAGVLEPKTKPKTKTKTLAKATAKTKARKGFIKPMLATLHGEAFNDPNWIFEIKWDGYRAIAETGDFPRLYSRNSQPFEERYADIFAALSEIKHQAVIDGEIVVVDKEGKSHFQDLQNYGKGKPAGTLAYYAFDLLELDGNDLRGLPLLERKELLQQLIPKRSRIRYSDHVTEDGVNYFKVASKAGLEGIMAKKADSIYEEGHRADTWLKVKTHMRQEAVIIGYTEPQGARAKFGSLLLGVYEGKTLKYAGHVGTGFNAISLGDISKRMQKIVQDTPALTDAPNDKGITWVKPILVCEVEFSEWTEERQMRHPSFKGLREDKPATEVHAELSDEETTPKKTMAKDSESFGGETITHMNKVFWPKDGYTKGDLARYYADMAPVLLPYLKDRPQSLNRFPNGIDGQHFYQKNHEGDLPKFVRTTKIHLEHEEKTIRSIVCDNKETLMYMVQLGCIELNPWHARLPDVDRPDYMLIDLDPEDISFEKVIETAKACHAVLEKAGIPSFCKTSGKTGIHIIVPMGGKYTTEQVRQFAEVVVRIVNTKIPEFTSLERSPAKRQKKVYLDYLQNNLGQTVASAYSVRPWSGATVSAPLDWKEVKKGLDPAKFTIKTMAKRLKEKGDLWKGMLGKGINLTKAITELAKQQKRSISA